MFPLAPVSAMMTDIKASLCFLHCHFSTPVLPCLDEILTFFLHLPEARAYLRETSWKSCAKPKRNEPHSGVKGAKKPLRREARKTEVLLRSYVPSIHAEQE